jgi:hypothetical protein
MIGAVGLILNNNHNLVCSSYNSEPDYLGFDILQFIYTINLEKGWDKFKKLSRNIKPINMFEINSHGFSQIKYMYNNSDTRLLLDNNIISDRYCDYAYIINLDDMVLEYYIGYQTKPQKGNRFGTKSLDGEYYPCRLCSIYDLSNIDSDYIIDDIIENMKFLDGYEDKYENVSSIYRKYKLKKLCNINAIAEEQ